MAPPRRRDLSLNDQASTHLLAGAQPVPLSTSQPPMQSLQLNDGRRLAWYEYGDPQGAPCIYTTGTPASGLTGVMYDAVARETGVRFISVDKPGYGHSDFLPGRRLVDWPRDVAALADHLDLSRVCHHGRIRRRSACPGARLGSRRPRERRSVRLRHGTGNRALGS